ncbi:LOW QUALITY PROTEIN: intermembrane lipid transfer protein VPS13B-like [Uloborus diversus]|uniref:LOW QUALITY PROTEIN: intermembrane lipid transfer protein VPS13B-like n=1 Tax=Uloborus diversus TaxID=327109 RepID=UPI002409319D|nr:LOW QUALITY PROTEIN: intermembrane lipid transfer protein VPS13B-like [Uloborus diversus]
MFKLESYITPLLLNYVDKYIKNLKPEDSQFSLWGGDAVFCNLDLRLDVLEQELQLPFTFVNGHIHELRIHIPWTKLGSEPVIITINTIECILKLCTDSDVPDCDAKTVLLSKKISSNKLLKRPEVIEAPPGYVQSLINRVISNISIVCNNVILKYVEDDIVLSLNIKSVELFSVNDKWEKAFADLSAAVRKVIHMQDLTVCLDKRDASGKIETYQDPLLYRCSSTWRLYSIYNSPHSKYPAVTRIHMFCENLDFSLTNQQIPMFLRLMNLCIALQNQSTFKDKEAMNVIDDKTDCTTSTIDEHTAFESRTQEESWGNWAWSFIPDMTPMWNASEVEEQEKEANLLKSTKILHFGIYIGKTSCILKQTVVVPDPTCCGSSKFIFSPLLVLDLYGCCMEFTSKGKDFVNMQIGISGSTVTGLEDCACGYEDFSSNESPKVFLKSGVPPSSGHAYNFLSSSLFDPLAVENCNQRRKYCFNKEEHLSKFTEEVLVERFPAFAFDYLYELDVPEEWLDKMSTVTTLFLEESNWHESSTCRLVFGPLCVDVTSSLVHRISKLIFSAKDGDYSYYSESSKPSSHAVNIDDDIIEQLEETVPVRMYHLTLFKPVIRLYVADHITSFTAAKHESKRKKKKNIRSSKYSSIPKASEANVCVELYADCVDLQSSMPMYPLRLVKIIDKLPDTSQFLLHHCYNSSSVKVFDLEVSLQKESVSLLPERNILQKTSLTFFMKTLMLPDIWTNLKNITLCEYAFECDKIGIALHEAQFFILLIIFHSWTSKHFNSIGVEKIRSMMQILKVGPALLILHISGSTICFDPDFFSWLSSVDKIMPTGFDSEQELSLTSSIDFKENSTCSSRTKEQSVSQSLSKSQSTLLNFASKEGFLKRLQITLLECSDFLSQLVLEIDIESLCGLLPQPCTSIKQSSTTASATVALSIKNNQNQLGLCIHMDSKSVNVVLSPFQMQMLVNCLKVILPASNFIEVIKSWNSYFCSKTSELSECGSVHPEDKIPELSKAKNIFDETNAVNKNLPGGDASTSECKIVKKLTVWSQLTLSKLSVVLIGKLPNSYEEDFKVQLDIEEIISSLDIQKVYSKFITKLTSLGAHCFIRKNDESQWHPGPYDGCHNQPFLVATYTRALCSNAKQKWNLKQNSNCDDSELEYISEIDLKVKSFDAVLWMSVFDVICKTFYIFFRLFQENCVNDTDEGKSPVGAQFCSKNLPLLYIETNIVRMYLPENSVLDSFENISDEKDNSTTAKKEILLLQLDYITLTSQIENPLSRIILNSDLYYSAINAKTEGLSGTAVEDRQYQIDISGLVLGSVSGINILHKEEFKKDLHSYHPITMGENPALEWNIGVVREKRNSSPTTYMITYIVSPINVRIAIAPAIICDNPNKTFLNEKIIVAGISFELSITKDICFYLSDHQICFIYSLFKNNLNFITELYLSLESTEISKKDSSVFSNAVSSPTNDTCVSNIYMPPQIFKESNEQPKLAMNKKFNKHNFVPFEALVTASSISFTFFYHDIGKINNLNEHSHCDSKHEDISSSSKTENVSQKSRLHPYLYISVTQPHSYILCYPDRQKFESSCFDLLVNGSSSAHVVQKPHTSSVLNPGDFKLCYLETRPGEPHVKTGIRPAFFTIRITDFLSTPGTYFLKKFIQKEIEVFNSVMFNAEGGIEDQNLINEVRKRKIWTDDLRKGMFQFIQAYDQDIEPKPNEIVFCPASKNHRASMTWCYPEPRALTKVEVSPVPFQCDDGNSSSEFQIITCYLQYWNSTSQEYINLCDFMLSETNAFALDLPSLTSDSLGVSDRWRVLLDRPTYIDDDGAFGKENPCLSPLALAACMCIDSCFDPCITPVVQVKVTSEQIKVIAYNYFEKSDTNLILHGFKFDNQSPSSHEFAALSFITPVISYIKWSTKLKGEFSSGLTCEVLEYRNLTMLPIISPVDVHCNTSINLFQEKVPAIDIELTFQPCFVHLTQSVVHTFMYTMNIFSKHFSWLSSFQDNYYDSVLPNYYFICNNLRQSVTIGQAGTEEYIHLAPFEVHAYSWWCHKIQQKLRISMEKILPKWSKEFTIDSEGIQEVTLGSDIIFVKVKSLSNLQKQVILDGQLVIHNQLHFPLQVKINMSGSENCYIEPVSSMKTSAAHLISSENYESLSIAISAASNSEVWSSEVHAHDNALIKIPWDSDHHYCNAWCQIAYQELTEHSFCITVFISPLFVLRSNLPIPLKVDVTSKGDDLYTLDLIGRGSEVNLFESSEWDHKLKLDFHSMPDVAVSVSSLTISVCDLSPITLQSFTGKENLHEVCHNLQSRQHELWPYSFLERKTSSTFSSDSQYFGSENQSSLAPAIASQNVCFRLKVDRVQRWIGLNSLLVDIKPYVILVNRLNIDLYLFEKGEIQWMLPPNSVAMPTSSSDGFQLSVLEDGKHFFSQFLKVDDASNNSNYPSTVHPSSLLYIPNSGRISVVIKIGDKREYALTLLASVLILYITLSPACLLKIKAEVQEGIIIITVFPEISFLTKASKDLQLYLLCSFNVDKKMKKDCRQFIAVPFTSGSSSFSSEPFVITSHKHEDILYLILKNDPCPLLLLHNQTDMDMFYGQSHVTSEGNVIFEEIQTPYIVPLLKTNSSSYYMFPAIQEMFPNIPDKVPLLCLGITSMDNKYLWSAPFGIDIDKQFVHILGVCDFMIQSKQIGHTVHLFIDSVNRIELTAKEIRTRIAQATKTNTHNSSVEESSSEADICDQSKNVFKYINKTKASKVLDRKELMTPKLPFHVYINARIIHISLKICDELKELNKSIEVLRLNIDNVLLFSRPSSENFQSNAQDISLCLEHVQFDNQIDLENNIVYDFPVILQKYIASNANSSVRAERSDIFLPNKVRENSMFIMNVVVQLGSEEHNFIFNSLSIRVLPLSLYVEDTFYYRICSLWKSYIATKCHEHYSSSNDVEFPRELTFISESFVNPIHFQNLKIEISEVSLSLHASLKIYLSLEQSMLRFKPFEKKNLFSTPYEVGRMLVLHYLTGALFRAGWVVGSLDILGNPAGFARAVGAGMSDFIYLPYQGLFQGPRAFVSGLSNGALSLFTQISSGALICFASLASSISRNMDFMCLDDEHLARQELMRCHLPHGVSEGLLQGLSGFGLSLLSAIAGIVDHPLKVLISPSTPLRTASGIVGGFGKGIIGMFTKPIGGAAELLSQPVYGLLHGAGWLNCPKRQYQPVNISFDMCTSSSLKYSRKVAQCCIYEGVIALMEATYANENGEYEKKILLLNSEALCVLDEDETTLQSTFPVSDINCHIMKSDRSTLIVLPDKEYKKQESCDAVDRIVEYVKKNCLENTNVDENVYSSEDCMLDCLTKSTSSYHMFFLYPRERNLFLTLFLYAKNKAMKKGFYTC